MPDLNDFYAFKSTSSGSSSTDVTGIGCLSPTTIIIVIVLIVVYFIGNI